MEIYTVQGMGASAYTPTPTSVRVRKYRQKTEEVFKSTRFASNNIESTEEFFWDLNSLMLKKSILHLIYFSYFSNVYRARSFLTDLDLFLYR
jgi:hypothetical protein